MSFQPSQQTIDSILPAKKGLKLSQQYKSRSQNVSGALKGNIKSYHQPRPQQDEQPGIAPQASNLPNTDDIAAQSAISQDQVASGSNLPGHFHQNSIGVGVIANSDTKTGLKPRPYFDPSAYAPKTKNKTQRPNTHQSRYSTPKGEVKYVSPLASQAECHRSKVDSGTAIPISAASGGEILDTAEKIRSGHWTGELASESQTCSSTITVAPASVAEWNLGEKTDNQGKFITTYAKCASPTARRSEKEKYFHPHNRNTQLVATDSHALPPHLPGNYQITPREISEADIPRHLRSSRSLHQLRISQTIGSSLQNGILHNQLCSRPNISSTVSLSEDCAKEMAIGIAFELQKNAELKPSPDLLTKEALILKSGVQQPHLTKHAAYVSITSDISENDEDDEYIFESKEKIRATQGEDPAKEHLDFDGRRMPPPCDWENDRPKFDNSFINSYILEWLEDSCPQAAGFITRKEFTSGEGHAKNLELDGPYDYPTVFPTPGETQDLEAKRMHQTSYVEAYNMSIKCERKLIRQKRQDLDAEAHRRRIMNAPAEKNPFSPKIPMYLRPAESEDAKQITQIYNAYVLGSNITEDQIPITDHDTNSMIENSKSEKLPFIVAVKGRCAPPLKVQGRKRFAKKATIPKIETDIGHETVVGFAFNERFNYGFAGTSKGRSRFTTTVQVFVDHKFQRMGVGRNLMDRLIHMLSPSYGYRGACDWVNPRNDEVHECGGSGQWHQILVHVPVLKQVDSEFHGIAAFLYSNFCIKEQYRLKSTGRTRTAHCPGKWLDLAIFQYESAQEGSFDPYH